MSNDPTGSRKAFHTPIAIVIFSPCHQAIGCALLLFTAFCVQAGMIETLRDFDWFSAAFLLMLLMLSLPRWVGGMALRRQGKRAWKGSVGCFAAVAVAEVGLACFTGGGLVCEPRFGLIYLGLGASLSLLTGLVLSYLFTPVARVAFDLPAIPRVRPRCWRSPTALFATAWVLAMVTGAALEIART
jgi:hypothetical protein